MKERGILFSSPMVRALLAGTKSQTRRALRVQPDSHHWESLPGYELKRSKIVTIKERCAVKFSHSIPQNREWDTALDWLLCPYGQPGDRLWVRETWGYDWYDDGQTRAWKRPVYRADPGAQPSDQGDPAPWRPSIHMPRRLSRILLEVTDVRVERLQAISEADALAEGVFSWWREQDDPASDHPEPRELYRQLWESINGVGSWDANPWVWAVSFKRVQP